MKNYYFLLMFFLSILSFGQTIPDRFILKVKKSEKGLFIPASGNYLLTVKNEDGVIIDNLNNVLSTNLTLDKRFLDYYNNEMIGYQPGDPVSPTTYYNHLKNEAYASIQAAGPDAEFTLEFKNYNNEGLRIHSAILIDSYYSTETQMTEYNVLTTDSSDDILEIVNWGSDIIWNNDMSLFMYLARNVTDTSTDIPNFSNVTDMHHMFYYVQSNIPVGLSSQYWDTSNVTNMRSMFEGSEGAYVDNWNTSKVTDMAYMFHGVRYFNQGIFTHQVTNSNGSYTAWDTSNVENMAHMFSGCYDFDAAIGNWNTSKVTNMQGMFYDALYFNQDIGNWNTSNVTDMANMFHGTRKFNKDISTKVNGTSWNTAKVTNMSGMFSGTWVFNQPIGNWNTSNVKYMSSMFYKASVFNQPIGDWNTSSVTNMSNMFETAANFNQPIGNWNTSSVKNMSSMFEQAFMFNQDISTKINGTSWNTAKVTNMSGMFKDTSRFNESIVNWDTSNVTNMSEMFAYSKKFNQDITEWDTSNVTNMASMFEYSKGLELSLADLKLDNLTNLNNIFSNSAIECEKLTETLLGWKTNYGTKNLNLGDVSTPVGLNSIKKSYGNNTLIGFWGLPANQYLANCIELKPFIIKVSKSTNGLLIPATGNYLLTIKDVNGNIVDGINQIPSSELNINTTPIYSSINTAPPQLFNHLTGNITLYPSFTNALAGTDYILEFLNLDNSGLRIQAAKPTVNHTNRFFPNIAFENTANIKEIIQWGNVTWAEDMSHFMSEAFNVILIATDSPNFSNVKNMAYMFSLAEKFNGDIGGWDTSNVTDMNHMFQGAKLFNQNIGNWNTSKVTDMSYMFATRSTVITNHPIFNQDISTKTVTRVDNSTYTAWDTSKVTNMEGMFSYTIKFDQPIGNWNTSNVTNMSGMFFGASIFNKAIGNWNTSKVTDMSDMFTFASLFDQNISTKIVTVGTTYTAWDTSNVTNMSRMFDNAEKFNHNIGNWNTSKVTDMNHMFSNTLYFDQDISTKTVTVGTTYTAWDTSNVRDMSSMFHQADVFNKEIGNWNTSNVTNMSGMFGNARNFDKDISTKTVTVGATYTAWNTSSVLNMGAMFQGASVFNKDLSSWDVSSVTDMNRMFQLASVFNQDLSHWDVRSVKDMAYMFDRASNFTSNLGGWNLSGIVQYFPPTGLTGITGVFQMFYNSGLTCKDFSNTLIGWNANYANKTLNLGSVSTTSGIRGYNTNASSAFINLTTTNGWTITNAAEDLTCTADTPFIIKIAKSESGLLIPAHGDYLLTIKDENGNVINNIYKLSSDTFTSTLTTGVTTGPPTESLNHLNTGSIGSAAVETPFILEFFNKGTSPLKVSTTTPDLLERTYEGHENILDIIQWGENINWNTSMKNFMYGATNLTISATDKPNFSNVTNMSFMFYFNENLADIPRINEWDVSNVTDMSHMFHIASSFNSNIGDWNTSSVRTMNSMFTNAAEFNQPIVNWVTSSVTDMASMFNAAVKFNQDIITKNAGIWDTSNVTDMSYMFQGAIEFNGKISNWNTSNVYDFRAMFSGAKKFNQDISIREIGGKKYWDISKANSVSSGLNPNVSYVNNMIFDSGLDCTNFSLALISWDNFITENSTNQAIDISKYLFGSSEKLIPSGTTPGNFDVVNRGYNTDASIAYDNLSNVGRISGGVNIVTCEICTNPPKIDENINNTNSPKFVISTIKDHEKAKALKEYYNDSENSFISLKKGLVLPRSSTSENFRNPVKGLIYYDTTDSCIKMYDGSAFHCLRKRCFLISLETDEQF